MNEDKYEALKLENQLCFLLYAYSREIIKQYKPFLDELGLTYTQYIAMLVLWDRKSLTVKELGECLYLDSGTLTPMLKKMESRGLVTRTRSTRDERNLIVAATGTGMALRERAVCIPAKMAQCAKLDTEDAAVLYKLLYKLLGISKNDN